MNTMEECETEEADVVTRAILEVAKFWPNVSVAYRGLVLSRLKELFEMMNRWESELALERIQNIGLERWDEEEAGEPVGERNA
jgi:hypothetical protein